MSVPERVLKLVEVFDRNLQDYKSGGYKEAQLRKEFIDPFFRELGWDMDNRQGYAEAYKDVIHEDSIKVGNNPEAPDYCFRIGGTRKFFLEAKKPSVDIKHDTHPAYQLRRYAWSSKLPLSILTDFEEFAVYDCRVKPSSSDGATVARIHYYTYDRYPDIWDDIAAVFSKEAVLKGSFDRYAETKKGKKGTAEVDIAFLREIESWRDELARNIALRNPALTRRQLNFAVQRTIDRIIFLRICEDRSIEDYQSLMVLLNGANVYQRLCQHFRRADQRYNSGLFHFQEEKGQVEPPDELSLSLVIDDKPLKNIIKRLYYPESPYEFSVLPADILGQVYEQFLGKVIRLTAGHRAVVEDKPEVKKAGGVFYTPTYIVDYIVANTVGKLLDGKTPDDAAKLRILDPACGSGSFLIGAYQHLLDWHLAWYTEHNPEEWTTGRAPRLVRTGEKDWRLTTDERKRILLNNIYGVDIDPQAVEVTKLSLLLKVLEGETKNSINRQTKLFHERALPDLAHNIKCGNSLIGSDFYVGTQIGLFDEEERYRINVFDWEKEFPEIFQAGGFDAVIGNPPYGAFFSDAEKKYIRNQYMTYKNRYDSYIYFIEKSIMIINKKGYISFITPELWLMLESCSPLRKLIFNKVCFENLIVMGEDVFSNAVVNTIVFVFNSFSITSKIKVEKNNRRWEIPIEAWENNDNLQVDYRLRPEIQTLISKVNTFKSQNLSNYGEVIQGITSYDKYRGQDEELIKKRGYHFNYKHDENCEKWLAGKNIARYSLNWSGEWLRYGPWLAAPRDPRFFNGSRLLFREVPGPNKRIQATLVEEEYYHGHSITPFKPFSNNSVNHKYILGCVNSILISWYGGYILPNFGKNIFPKLNPQDIKMLPIRTIDFSSPTDVARHDRMVTLVNTMLDLHRQRADAKTNDEKTAIKRLIETTDSEIDRLVYELYDLTDEEIALIEGET